MSSSFADLRGRSAGVARPLLGYTQNARKQRWKDSRHG